MKQFEIPGQVAVITGAARGIGLAAAQLLAEAGATVALLDIDGGTAKTEAGRIGAKAAAWTCDVTSEAAVEAVFADVIGRYGRMLSSGRARSRASTGSQGKAPSTI